MYGDEETAIRGWADSLGLRIVEDEDYVKRIYTPAGGEPVYECIDSKMLVAYLAGYARGLKDAPIDHD